MYLSEDLPLIVRPASPTRYDGRTDLSNDYAFILDTWLQYAKKTEPACFIPSAIFKHSQTKLINSILDQAITSVVCLDDEPDLIIGYLVHEPHSDNRHIIHWGMMKSNHRRQGYMKLLMKQLGLDNKQLICTQYFKKFKVIQPKLKLIYDPTLLETHYHE